MSDRWLAADEVIARATVVRLRAYEPGTARLAAAEARLAALQGRLATR